MQILAQIGKETFVFWNAHIKEHYPSLNKSEAQRSYTTNALGKLVWREYLLITARLQCEVVFLCSADFNDTFIAK